MPLADKGTLKITDKECAVHTNSLKLCGFEEAKQCCDQALYKGR